MEFIESSPKTWFWLFAGILFIWSSVSLARAFLKWGEHDFRWTSYRKFQVVLAALTTAVLVVLAISSQRAGEAELRQESEPEGIQKKIEAAPPVPTGEELKEAAEERREKEIPTRTLEESVHSADDYIDKAIQRSKENKE